MDAASWQMISIAGFSIAGILFFVLVFLFIKQNIVSVIGDLSGRTASKQIQKIREETAAQGKYHKPGVFRLEQESSAKSKGKSTRFTKSGNTGQTTDSKQKIKTVKEESLQTEVLREESVFLPEEYPKTDVLAEDAESIQDHAAHQATEVLFDEQVLPEDATEVLADGDTTEVLAETGIHNEQNNKEDGYTFKLIKDVKVIHSDEVI